MTGNDSFDRAARRSGGDVPLKILGFLRRHCRDDSQ